MSKGVLKEIWRDVSSPSSVSFEQDFIKIMQFVEVFGEQDFICCFEKCFECKILYAVFRSVLSARFFMLF